MTSRPNETRLTRSSSMPDIGLRGEEHASVWPGSVMLKHFFLSHCIL
ncbi:hypothetical protein DPEC_G00374100 [Dallia pectoralis]|nr:hypothetical protein DPEC_G00374100 [Dallia pectoralis]